MFLIQKRLSGKKLTKLYITIFGLTKKNKIKIKLMKLIKLNDTLKYYNFRKKLITSTQNFLTKKKI